MDVGIYPLNFASMVFGDEVDSITGTAVMTETGVDAQNSITITYKDGKMAASAAALWDSATAGASSTVTMDLLRWRTSTTVRASGL